MRHSIRYAIRHAVDGFLSDDCLTLAASLAFYTLFALPPLLFLLVTIVSTGMTTFLPPDEAPTRAMEFLRLQASNLIGHKAASAEIGTIMELSRTREGTWWQSLLSLAGVLVAATGLVSALQSSLNRVWGVKPVDGAFAISFLWKRIVSLGMILCFGFLLLVSFVLSTLLAAIGSFVSSYFALSGMLPIFINQTISLLTSWVFFTAIFRFMPDARVPWRHAYLGGLLTVVLFTMGRTALFFYLSIDDPAARLGSAASSLVVILLWVYYSSSVLLLGAEFTACLARFAAVPVEGAARVEERVTVVGRGDVGSTVNESFLEQDHVLGDSEALD